MSSKFRDGSAVLAITAPVRPVAAHVELIAAVAGTDAADLIQALVVAVDHAGAGVHFAARTVDVGAAGLPRVAGVVIGSLLALHGEVVADAGQHGVVLGLGTDDVGVVTGDETPGVAGGHSCVGVGRAVAIVRNGDVAN
jgi:prolyl-tRNA editing enzyme YbaK/EbsC (Cys-tRNA(Pro) deacylase)